MSKQIHSRLSDDFVKSILEKYLLGTVSVDECLRLFSIKRRRFFKLLNLFKTDPTSFSIRHKGRSNNRLAVKYDAIILKELQKEKVLIDDKDIPVKHYNYSFIKDQISKKHRVDISTPTIINRAKKFDFYKPRKKHARHDRVVSTNHPGELIQHDSSIHKFSPFIETKWYLITSLDDYSRFLCYAKLFEQESSWAHILAFESICGQFGIPLRYYVDSHSIFRFVRGRDSQWQDNLKTTDQVIPQWKQVLSDLNVSVTYALSPQAKGKIERPYQWLQDRLVRTCARENIRTIGKAQEVLDYEINRYNNHQVHSTTREIPGIRLEKAMQQNSTMFRPFTIPDPWTTSKDIFCMRANRVVDGYGVISFGEIKIKIKNAPLHEQVELRISPNEVTGISDIRIWHKKRLIDVRRLKNSDVIRVHF